VTTWLFLFLLQVRGGGDPINVDRLFDDLPILLTLSLNRA
jgi:hypothetical protein